MTDSENKAAILDDDDDRILDMEDPLDEFLKKPIPPSVTYPLTLTMDECLKMQFDPGRRKEWDGHRNHTMQDHEAVAVAVGEGKKWNHEVMQGVLAGAQCPVCLDKGYRSEVRRGRKTNFYFLEGVRCWCKEARFFQALAEEKLPRILQNFTIPTLRPSPKSNLPIPVQEREIKFLKAHADESFFFLGPPGTSKSVYAAALFRRAMRRNREYLWEDRKTACLWRVDGNHLFESEVAYATCDDKENFKRDITVEMIEGARRGGVRPVLVLEEIDKRKMTEFAALTLFRLVNAMDECEGQLILTSNLTMQGFRDMFLKSDIDKVRVDGAALLRRLTDPDKINVRDYFTIAL